MRRPVRLRSARAWLRQRRGVVRAGEYVRRYGVDRYTAYDELTGLGARLHPKDARWATRPQPVPRGRKTADEPTEDPGVEWVHLGGERILAVGYTSGGFPYGPTWEEVHGMEPSTADPDGPPF